MIARSILVLVALAGATAAQAGDGPIGTPIAAAPPPARSATLVVYGNDPCPKGSGDEVVVCARRPEGERYRIPKRFREQRPTVAQGSWTNRAMELDAANSAVLPNSCSPNGSNGQTGCFSQFLAQARAQKREDQAEAADIP